MDYCACKALLYNGTGLKEALIIYDICCQWSKKFMQRINNNFKNPTKTEIAALRLFYAVGKFHLGGHIDSCFSQYTLNYVKGAAQIDGEIMETVWATLKSSVASMRSMSGQHRREALDHQLRDHNWKKLTSCGALNGF